MSAKPHSLRSRATVKGVIAIVLWSSLALLALVTRDLPAFEVLAITFGIGGLANLLMPSSQQGLSARWRQPWAAFALTVFSLFGYHALYFVAFRFAPAVEVNLINYLWPLLIVMFAMLPPGASVNRWQIAGSLTGLSGVAFMMTGGSGAELSAKHLTGYGCAFAAALVWSSYSVLNRRFHAVSSSSLGASCMAVALLAALAHLAFESTIMPDVWQCAFLVLMGLGPVGIAFRLWDQGTKHGDLGVLGTLSYAAPVLSTLLLLLSGRAEAHWGQAVAVALLLFGAWLSVHLGRDRTVNEPNPGQAN